MSYTFNSSGGSAVERILPRISYKPNWEFAIWQGALQVRLRTPDSYAPEQEILVDHRFPLPHPNLMLTEESALQFVQHCVWSVERHEMREFFKLDGECVNPPAHGPDASLSEMYG